MIARLYSKCRLSCALGATALLAGACSAGPRTGFFDHPAPDAVPTTSTTGAAPGSDSNEEPTLRGGDQMGGATANPVLGAGCATGTSTAKRAPVYMLIVLDGSGSMALDHKWDAVVPALNSIFDDLAAKADPNVGVGLVGFSDDHDPTCTDFNPGCGPYPSSADVGVAVVDATQQAKLHARIANAQPSGSTPTLTALTGAYQSLQSFVPQAPLAQGGKKVVVLMTDGVPDPGGPLEQGLCVGAAKSELAMTLPSGPIFTFAVGIGDFPSTKLANYDPIFMSELAQAGGTAPAGCDPNATDVSKVCHFQVTPQGQTTATLTQSFIDAIDRIRNEAASCDFTLDAKEGATLDPSAVNVVFTDGAGKEHVIPQDTSNGWTYDDPKAPKKVTLHGSSCSEVTGDLMAKVSIVVGCTTVVAK
jgi:hypothetical protein